MARDGGRTRCSRAIRAYNEEDCVSLFELHRWLLAQRPPDLAWRAAAGAARGEGGDAGAARGARARARALLEGARRETRAGCSPSSSSTTGARRGRSGGSTSTTAGSTRRSCSTTATRSAGSSSSASRSRTKQSLVYTFSFPAQEHKLGRDWRSIRRPRRDYRIAVDDERGTSRSGAASGARRRAAPARADPATAAPDVGAARRRAALRDRTATRSPGARRDPRAAAPARPARRHARRGGAQPRRELPLRAGPAGLREDLERRAHGDRADAGRAGASAITALSHKAIHKFLEDVEHAADEPATSSAAGRRQCRRRTAASRARPRRQHDGQRRDARPGAAAARRHVVPVLARGHGRHVDTLFVDEGGQFALADALAVGAAARNLVLLGDPNQLPQVSQGSHPPGANASVLAHLLGEDETVQPGWACSSSRRGGCGRR